MDESGFPSADQGKTHVVGARGTKTQHKQGGTDRKNTTALVTICADGTSLRATIVFKRKGFKRRGSKIMCWKLCELSMIINNGLLIRGSFAVTYTSPVHAIMKSFKTYRPTAFDISPSNAQLPPPNGHSLPPAEVINRCTESPHPVTSPNSNPK